MTVLLGATFVLLLAAVMLSFNGMNEGVRNASPDEMVRLQGQIDRLRIEQERLDVERNLRQVRDMPDRETANPSEMDAMKAQLAAIEAEKAALEEGKELAEKKAETYRDEAGLIGQRELEKGDNELRRARMIRDALLIGRVSEYVADPTVGGVVVIEIVLPEHVQVGTVLAIRRNTGVLGKVTITDILPEGAIGSPMPGFGPVEPQQGDELIIPPQV
ncbi:MAG: hypothetical protein ACSHX7_05765 [Luteolibacter sp.]